MSATPGPVAANDLFTLFPTPLWVAELDAASRDAMGAVFDAIAAQAPDAASGAAAAAGSQRASGAALHRRPELAPLVALFVEECRGVLAHQHVPHGPLEVTSCSAHSGSGEAERPFRMIGNAYLAGLYVVRAPEGGCSVEFEDPRAQAHIVAPPRSVDLPPDAPVARVERGAGTLLMFPGWTRHRVTGAGGGPWAVFSMGLLFGEFADTIARPKWQGDAV